MAEINSEGKIHYTTREPYMWLLLKFSKFWSFQVLEKRTVNRMLDVDVNSPPDLLVHNI